MIQNAKTEQAINSFKSKGHIHRAFDRLIRKKLAKETKRATYLEL